MFLKRDCVRYVQTVNKLTLLFTYHGAENSTIRYLFL